jgi:hypothetical protein
LSEDKAFTPANFATSELRPSAPTTTRACKLPWGKCLKLDCTVPLREFADCTAGQVVHSRRSGSQFSKDWIKRSALYVVTKHLFAAGIKERRIASPAVPGPHIHAIRQTARLLDQSVQTETVQGRICRRLNKVSTQLFENPNIQV